MNLFFFHVWFSGGPPAIVVAFDEKTAEKVAKERRFPDGIYKHSVKEVKWIGVLSQPPAESVMPGASL